MATIVEMTDNELAQALVSGLEESGLIVVPKERFDLLIKAAQQARRVTPESYRDPVYVELWESLRALDTMGYGII